MESTQKILPDRAAIVLNAILSRRSIRQFDPGKKYPKIGSLPYWRRAIGPPAPEIVNPGILSSSSVPAPFTIWGRHRMGRACSKIPR